MREFSRFGTIEYLGLGVDADEATILDAVRQILKDTKKRREMGERGRSLVDGYGAARAAGIVLEPAQVQDQVETNGRPR